MPTATGKVRWFDEDKGYGFIIPDEGGGDVFVRPEDVPAHQHLKANQRVSFEAVRTETGNVAATSITVEHPVIALGDGN